VGAPSLGPCSVPISRNGGRKSRLESTSENQSWTLRRTKGSATHDQGDRREARADRRRLRGPDVHPLDPPIRDTSGTSSPSAGRARRDAMTNPLATRHAESVMS
jgi:hypothetical protein